MSEPVIYKGRGSAEMRDDYIDFINYVFGFNGNGEDFPKLLPKLYKPEYHPCENNYVVTVDGKLKSAIGVYPREFDIMGERLSSHGVGNVAVHPYSRSKGYMKELLNMAIRDMIASGADMSDLGGLRQRYGYFSYELVSPEYHFELNGTCMRHCFAGIPFRELELRRISRDDPLLDDICALHDKRLCHAVRPREQFYDIAVSWQDSLFAILDGDRFLGYYIGKLHELTLADNRDFNDVIRNYIAQNGSVTLPLPAYETELISAAEKLCGGLGVHNNQNYTIFHFRKVVSAYLKVKAATVGLIDGALTFRVRGIAGEETFRIEVKNGQPSVSDVEGGADLTLEHREAVAFFFGVVSPRRFENPLSAAWFPLPLYIASADHV